MKVNLRWITPNADGEIGYIARVSNPKAKEGDPVTKLILYLLQNHHVSPFEMACMCVEVYTTRDIGRQMLRHKSINFQEFSQRYSEVDDKPEIVDQARLQDHKNRQNSIPSSDPMLNDTWVWWQNRVWDFCWVGYKACLKMGIAKELARKLLPEGLTQTRMFCQGTIRDWLFYLSERLKEGTQYEHRQVALAIADVLKANCPDVFSAAQQAGVIGTDGHLQPSV